MTDKALIFIIISLSFFLPQKALCADFEYETNFTHGKRSQSNALDEESSLGEFHYTKYRPKISQNLQKFGYNASYELYDKDYKKHDDLSNRIHASQFGLWGLLWKEGAESLKFGTDFGYRIKRFEDNPDGEYNKIDSAFKLTLKDKNLYSVSGTYGFENYDFTETDKDEFAQSGALNLKRFFFDKKVSLLSSYELKHRDRESDDDRIEQTFKTGLDIKEFFHFFDLLRLRLRLGKDNTRSYFDEDEYYDFKYLKWYVRTEHKLTELLSGSIKFEQHFKDYKVFGHDYKSHKIENNWNYIIFKKKDLKVVLNPAYGFRHMDYDDSTSLIYNRHSLQTKIRMRKIKDWGTSVGFKWSDYDYYNKHSKDETSYSYLASIDKAFLGNNLKIFVDFKHKFKHYHHKPNINEDTLKAGLKGRF